MRAWSWNYLTSLVHDNEFDGVTRHTYLRQVGGDAIKCGKRLSDRLVLALHRALSSLVRAPRLHHAKIHRADGGTFFLVLWRSFLP